MVSCCSGYLSRLWSVAQILRAGDVVVAAARRPEKSPGLTKLKERHGGALQLVKLDVNDGASLKVLAALMLVSAVGPAFAVCQKLRNQRYPAEEQTLGHRWAAL